MNDSREAMPLAEEVDAGNCADCGAPLSGSVCAGCSLSGLLDESEGVPTGRHDGDGELRIQFGRYLLHRRLQAGGMGVVYIADDGKLKRRVALKMIRGSTFASESDIGRFTIEAEAAAGLDHRHIVPIYEVGLIEEQPFFTMKLIEGESLAERLRDAEGHRLPPREVAEIMAKISSAVSHAHQRGVLHRDLKPGNVLIDCRGKPWLTDFGLAKIVDSEQRLTCTSAQIGTPHYMPPEVARGNLEAVSTASDVWSLGVMLWEALHGAPPFAGATPAEIMRRIETDPPSRPSRDGGDRDLQTLALRCMEKDPSRRLSSAGELAEELERWLEGKPIRARPVGTVERLFKWVRRKPAWAALCAALLAGSVSSLVLWRKAEGAYKLLSELHERRGQALSLATATKLALDARAEVERDPGRAMLMAVRSVEITEAQPDGVLPEAVEALFDVLHRVSGRDLSIVRRSDVEDGFLVPDLARYFPPVFDQDPNRVLLLDYADSSEQGVLAVERRIGGEGDSEVLHRWRLWDAPSMGNRICRIPGTQLLASLGDSGEVRLWETAAAEGRAAPRPRRIGVLAIEGASIRQGFLRPAPDGRQLEGEIHFRPDDELLQKNRSPFIRFRIDPGTAQVLHAEAPRELPLSIGSEGNVEASDDGRWLVSLGGEDAGMAHIVRFGDEGPGEAFELPISSAKLAHPDFSPDGNWLVARAEGGEIWRFDLRGGSARAAALSATRIVTLGDPVHRLEFSPDSSGFAVAGSTHQVRVFSIDPPARILSVRSADYEVIALRWSPDGRWLATGGRARVVQVWPIDDSGDSPAPLTYYGLPCPVLDVGFSPNGNSLLATGQSCVYREWPFDGIGSGSIPRRLPGDNDRITDMAISPDERWVATARDGDPTDSVPEDGYVELASLDGLRSVRLGSHGSRATGVAFDPGGRWLASIGKDGFAKIWELGEVFAAVEAGRAPPPPRFLFDMTDTRPEYGRKLAFHPHGILYCVCGDGVLFEWDLNALDPAGDRRSYVVHTIRYILPDVEVSGDGRRLAVARHGWDAEPTEGFSQVGNMVLLFDVSRPGPPVPIAELPANFIDETNIAFSPDGRWLAAGGAGVGATVWDLHAENIAASRRVSEVKSSSLAGIAFSPDSSRIVLGGSDGRLHFWNWRRAERIRSIDGGAAINSISWLSDGRVACGGHSGRVELWETDLQRLKVLARRVAARGLGALNSDPIEVTDMIR